MTETAPATGYPPPGHPQPQTPGGVNRSLTAAREVADRFAPECWHKMSGGDHCRKPPGHAGKHRRTRPAPRARRYKDNTEYLSMMRRLLRAYARRMELEDPEQLRELIGLEKDLRQAIDAAARAFHTSNGGDYSWGEIGRQTGMTRQSAYQRWGKAETEQAAETVA